MNPSVSLVLARIDAEGAVLLRGLHAVTLARQVLEHVVTSAGYRIVFDPGSAPELVDYLTITASSGLRGAAIGAGVGGLVGLAFGRPLAGAVAGGGVGLVAGAAHGVNKVARGWRVRAVYDANGEPTVAIHALPA